MNAWVVIDNTTAWVDWQTAIMRDWPGHPPSILKKPGGYPFLVPKAPWLHTGAKPLLASVDAESAQRLIDGLPEIVEDA